VLRHGQLTDSEGWDLARALYIHWPFCLKKCPYCDFNSHVRSGVDAVRWGRALAAEVAAAGAVVPGRRVETIFFGGGTPSLMPPETVAMVMSAIGAAWEIAPDAEVTLEANPTSVEAARFRGYRDAGVNRLSMGVQALDDRDLRALGRLHDVAEARRAFDVARGIFPRVSFDLIYARQGQTAAAWRAELAEALSMAVDHLSLYQLTVEPGTRFGELAARGRLRGMPAATAAGEMYAVTQEVCAREGMPAYEVSNHARAGAESRHNLVYWRYGDYVGIGPGAHGRLTVGDQRWATEAIRMPEAWLAAVEQRGSGLAGREAVAPHEQAIEMLIMGLRLAEGIDPCRYATLAGTALAPDAIAELEELGLVRCPGDRLVATDAGRAVLDAVLRRLTA
jgi:putative oxygen-independent coproporphyrinogen III oxidase